MSVVTLPTAPTWPEEPLPLEADLAPPQPFPLDALPPVLEGAARAIVASVKAPAALVGGSLLAASSLATQHRADVITPANVRAPLSLFMASVAASGERKSAVDALALQPHRIFERAKVKAAQADIDAFDKLPRKERADKTPPSSPMFILGDPTLEGLTKLLHHGLPSVGVFSAEGGSFTGGHGMADESRLRTAAGFSKLWDGSPIDRVRALDGAIKLYDRRVALHLMLQPQAATTWLSDPTLRDQGLLSRVLVAYPTSTAGTRMFSTTVAADTREFSAYVESMRQVLEPEWAVTEHNELVLPALGIGSAARSLWISVHDDIERGIAGELEPVRALASKSAEQVARIAGTFAVLANPSAPQITREDVERAATLMQFYLGEALRLADARPRHEATSTAAALWRWLQARGRPEVSLVEICRRATPIHVRKASTARAVMATLEEHYLARPITGVVFEGTERREGWELRL